MQVRSTLPIAEELKHWAGKGGSNVKRNQMESTGKSEDMLAGRMETSRLDGGMGEKLEGAETVLVRSAR